MGLPVSARSRDAVDPPASETASLPPAPTLRRSVRDAASDLYYHSWRLVPANLAWGALLLAILAAAGLWSSLALLGLAMLGVAQAGIARLAALIARGDAVSLGDAFAAWRRFFVPALALGAGYLLAGSLLAFNVWYAVVDGGVPALAIGTLSAWGLVALTTFAVAAWPLLVDPSREAWRVSGRLRLAVLLVLAHPGRLLALAVLVVLVLAVSTAAFAALLTVSVAAVDLLSARYVLPAADRLEARLAPRSR